MERAKNFLAVIGLLAVLYVGWNVVRPAIAERWTSYHVRQAEQAHEEASRLVRPHYGKPWTVVRTRLSEAMPDTLGSFVALNPKGEEVRFGEVNYLSLQSRDVPKPGDKVYLSVPPTRQNDSWFFGEHVRVYHQEDWKRLYAEWQERVKPYKWQTDSQSAYVRLRIERGEIPPRPEAP